MSFLLDTNVLSELIKPKPEKKVTEWFRNIPNEKLYLSVLSLGEIRKGVERLEEGIKKNTIRLWLEIDLPNWFEDRILSIDALTADQWGNLQAKMKKPLPAIDCLLAATALQHSLHFVTRNKKDFNFPHLIVICPWD